MTDGTDARGPTEGRDRAVVIGAGIVGLCCAAYLQRDGWRVTLVDPGPPGESCSFGNAGMRSDGALLPVATPGILWRVPGMLLDPMGPLAIRWSYLPRLAPWLVRFVRSSGREQVEQAAAEIASLMAFARESYAPLIEAAGAGDLIRERGALEVFESRQSFEAARWAIELRQRLGTPIEVVGADRIRQIEPALGPVHAATYRSDMDHVINPLSLSQALAEMIRRDGGEIVQAEASGVEMGEHGPRHVVTEAGTRDADLVVVAAGSWSRRLAAGLGARVPLDTERGYHVMLPDPGVEMRTPVKSAEGGFYMTPMELGLRVAGTDELGGLDLPPNWNRVEAMLRRVRRLVPGLNEAGAAPWMGFRPSLPDSKPVISPIAGRPGVFLAFGHGHVGLTLGAITGRSIADMVAGRETPVDMTPFSADRF